MMRRREDEAKCNLCAQAHGEDTAAKTQMTGQEHPQADMCWLQSPSYKVSKLRNQEEVAGDLRGHMGSSEHTEPVRLWGGVPSHAGERGTGLDAGSAGENHSSPYPPHPRPQSIL